MNRTKVIIIAVIALLILFVSFLFYRSYNKHDNKEGDQITLNSDKPKEYSYEDVLKERENNNLPVSSAPTSSGNDLSASTEITTPVPDNNNYYNSKEQDEIIRIQKQIRENNIASEDNSSSYNSYVTPARTVVQKTHKHSKENVSVSAAIEHQPEIKNSRFFSAGNKRQLSGNSIRATVHGDQIVMDGSTLKMRLLEDVQADGVGVPRNTFVYGTVKIQNERVEVHITSVRVRNNLFKFEKEVFDRDAIKGIYVPGNIKSETRSEATDQSLNEINPSVDGLIGSGVNAVVSAGKSVLSRNIKKIKVTIKTNYEIYLQ